MNAFSTFKSLRMHACTAMYHCTCVFAMCAHTHVLLPCAFPQDFHRCSTSTIAVADAAAHASSSTNATLADAFSRMSSTLAACTASMPANMPEPRALSALQPDVPACDRNLAMLAAGAAGADAGHGHALASFAGTPHDAPLVALPGDAGAAQAGSNVLVSLPSALAGPAHHGDTTQHQGLACSVLDPVTDAKVRVRAALLQAQQGRSKGRHHSWFAVLKSTVSVDGACSIPACT